MIKILFIDTAHPYLMEELTRMGYQCDCFEDYNATDFKRIIHQYDGIIIRSKIKLNQDILSKASKLRFIARVGAGMENIDREYAESKGIICLNAPEGNRDAVGEHTLGMLLSLLNHLNRVDREVRRGIWIREGNRGTEIKGKTVGIIGYGNMGSAFAQRLKGFEAQVIAYDKYKTGYSNDLVTESTMDELFENTDILSLHVPLTEETDYLVNDDFLKKFKKNIYLINTSRGRVVKTADLVKNMQEEKVLGAALDVMEYEKLSFENIETAKLPPAFQYLIQADNVILSPHIAGWTIESNYKLAKVLVDKIKKVMEHK